jgi:hypothetical protein
MRFHTAVRSEFGRMAAALLILLLAAPVVAPGSLSVADERAASPAHHDGMAPAPTHAASAQLAIASAGVAAPHASATSRVMVSFHPLLCRIVTDTTSRPPVAVKAAPTILRV